MITVDIKSAIADLNTQSPSAAIHAVLASIAQTEPDPIALEQHLRGIASCVGTTLKAVRQTHEMVLKNLNIKPVDLGLAICRELLESKYAKGVHLKQTPDASLYVYQKTHWIKVSEAAIRSELQEIAVKYKTLTNKSVHALVVDAVGSLRDYLGGDPEILSFLQEPSPVINCLNGELWFNQDGSVELRPHKPESLLMYCLPYVYDPKVKCPIYDKAILEIFSNSSAPADMVRHINEFLGYAIQPSRPIPVFWLFIGHGANGKTKFLQTACNLLSADFIHNVHMSSFDRDRFSVSQLLGKLLMIDDDIKLATVLPDGLLKKISEAKLLTARNPYGKTSFTFLCSALPVMVGNSYPVCHDLSDGLQRRAMVVPFDRHFLGKDQDPTIFDAIWKNEMSGVLNRAIEGYQRVMKRKAFLPPADCIAAFKDFLAHGNPLYAFLREAVAEEPEARITFPEFRAAYTAWAKGQNIKNLSVLNKTLKRRLKGLGYEIGVHNGYPCITGHKLFT